MDLKQSNRGSALERLDFRAFASRLRSLLNTKDRGNDTAFSKGMRFAAGDTHVMKCPYS